MITTTDNVVLVTSLSEKTVIFPEDENGRDIKIYTANDIAFCGTTLVYPNTLMFDTQKHILVAPHNETVMSLRHSQTQKTWVYDIDGLHNTETAPVFFFVYNTENYYHFVYDTLPYLISFIKLKTTIPNLKLLMNYPSSDKTEFFKFVVEFLEILGIKANDILLLNANTLYKTVYISDSYTHGVNSNLPPRKEIYEFYKNIVQKCISEPSKQLPKNLYVSRRSWLHGDKSNIGTNYTERRKFENEDVVIEFLNQKGFTEIFTECLSIKDKIQLFSQAEKVIGPIGGGLCNVLFSEALCRLMSINSPCFLDVNKRFEFSFSPVEYIPFNDTFHTDSDEFKLYMRVQVGDIIGEIIEKTKNSLTIVYSEVAVAGWNTTSQYKTIVVDPSECKRLDEGLNSPWSVNLAAFKKEFEQRLEHK